MSGRLKVDAILRELSSREISEWMAFYELEPFGDEWRQTGTIAAAAVAPYAKAGVTVKPEQFMPIRPETEDEPIEDDAMFLMAWQGLAAMQQSEKRPKKK